MTKDSINNLYFCESSWAKLKIIAVTLLEGNENLVEALERVTAECSAHIGMLSEKGVHVGLTHSIDAEEILAEHKDRMKELTGE